MAADDAEAKATVMGLIEEIGFAPIDAGSLAGSWRQQTGTPVFTVPVTPDRARELLSEASRHGA